MDQSVIPLSSEERIALEALRRLQELGGLRLMHRVAPDPAEEAERLREARMRGRLWAGRMFGLLNKAEGR